jgi:D-serine deaminase-like pyridoxal phosphate-dependent protein
MRVHGGKPPRIGDVLYLMPRHVCPTVNNFNDALIVSAGRIERVERVTARGREHPLMMRGAAEAISGKR